MNIKPSINEINELGKNTTILVWKGSSVLISLYVG